MVLQAKDLLGSCSEAGAVVSFESLVGWGDDPLPSSLTWLLAGLGSSPRGLLHGADRASSCCTFTLIPVPARAPVYSIHSFIL